ncbi:MAG: sulfatase-like hydrolase/transferase [Prosthecobacter sp.]
MTDVYESVVMGRVKRICLFLLTFGLASLACRGAERPPNIVFILADDVGQEVLGCYGGESYPTPHLDELARTGMRFTHCYSMPVCHPSRITLMTGKYPKRHGRVTWGSFPTKEESTTFANRLRNAGYATGIAGKWQLTLLGDDPSHPQRLGFESSDLFGWHEGPRYYEPMIYQSGKLRDDTLGHYGPDLYVRSLVEFMKAHRDGPFLAYFPMALCHDVTDDLDEPVPHGPFDRYDSYAEMATEMDRSVGRIVAALNALKLREQTVILFTGDNGTPQNMIVRAEGGKLIREAVVSMQNGKAVPGGKKTLFDTGTRVPLIANWPGTILPGQVVDDLVDFSDFLPTFAELAGQPVRADERLDGHSFAKRLRGKGAASRTWAHSEEAVLPKPGGVEPDGESSGLFWVRTQRWKLYSDGRFYDMEMDLGEASPLRQEDLAGEARDSLAALRKAVQGFTAPGR